MRMVPKTEKCLERRPISNGRFQEVLQNASNTACSQTSQVWFLPSLMLTALSTQTTSVPSVASSMHCARSLVQSTSSPCGRHRSFLSEISTPPQHALAFGATSPQRMKLEGSQACPL